jgi:hypothetical protein
VEVNSCLDEAARLWPILCDNFSHWLDLKSVDLNYLGDMKNLLAAGAILLMVGCAPDPVKLLSSYSTEGLTYENTSVYYSGKLAATLASVEVALDDGKLVQEATFVLTSSEYNDVAVVDENESVQEVHVVIGPRSCSCT